MPAAASLSNYTLQSQSSWINGSMHDCGKYWNANPQGTLDETIEFVAWSCNQLDDCQGFTVFPDKGFSMYMKSVNNGIEFDSAISSGGQLNPAKMYKKTSKGKKAFEIDTNDPSILSDPVTGIIFDNDPNRKWKISGWSGSDNTWGNPNSFTTNGFPTLPNYGCCNNTHDIKVPLGWRFAIGDSGIYNGCGGSAHTFILNGDGVNRHIADGAWDDAILVENRGFDVVSNWDTMVSKGVDPVDERRIKYRYCNTFSTISTSLCQNFFADPDSGYDYDVAFANLCNGLPNWPNDTTHGSKCIQSVNRILKSSASGQQAPSQQFAQNMVNTFCTAHPTDPVCACFNVVNLGANKCFKEKSSLPGCSDLKSSFGTLPADAQVTFSDIFCASEDCITNAWEGNNVLLPSTRESTTSCPDIQQCITDLRGSVANYSTLDISCKQSLTVSGVPGGSPPRSTSTSSSGSSPGSSSGSSPGSSSSSSPDSKTKTNSTTIFIIVGIVLFLIMIFGLAVVLLI